MGNACQEKIPRSKLFTSISYSKLDKEIFLVENYMEDKIEEKIIINLFPLINISLLKLEKNSPKKKRHNKKWYEMSLSQLNKILSYISIKEIIKSIEEEKKEEEKNEKEEKEKNINLLEKLSLLNKEISNSEQGLRNYYLSNPIHFEKRVFKSPPLIYRWLSWIIMSGIPINRNYIYYYNLLTYDLNKESQIQIEKDLNRTFDKQNSNLDFKESLFRILKAISILDKEMSYVQGINFIVGFLLVISDKNEIDTFYFIMALFSNTFAFKFGMRGFYLENFPLFFTCTKIFEEKVKKYFIKIHNHLNKIDIPYISWISTWMQMIYVNVFPNNILLRIWDCFFCNGIPFLISFGLSILELIQNDILEINDLNQMQEFFKLLNPELENNFKDKNKKINYDIEILILNAVKKYYVSEEEIKDVINKDFKNYNFNYIYEYKRIRPNKNKKIEKNKNNKNFDSDEDLEVEQETVNTNERVAKKGIKSNKLERNNENF